MKDKLASSEMGPGTLRANYVFRGIEYVISVTTTNNGRNLVVEVDDKLTADQWRGKFDVPCKKIIRFPLF